MSKIKIEKDIIYNIEDWRPKRGKNDYEHINVLLITGLSGSGKSTLSRKIAHDNNAIHIELDQFQLNRYAFGDKYPTKGQLIIQDYFNNVYGGRVEWNGENSPENFYDGFRKFFRYLLEYANNHYNQLFVIEGLQIFGIMSFEDIEGYPCIIKGTTMLKSMIRSYKRDGLYNFIDRGENNMNTLKIMEGLFHVIKWYIDRDRKLKEFNKYMKISYNN